jgi:hypothetical protein
MKKTHKLNPAWQTAHDELHGMFGPEAAAGVQHMYDLAAVETDPAKRTVALVRGYADNCANLASEIAKTGSTAEEGIAIAKASLEHTLKHFASIADVALHGVTPDRR